MDAMMKRLQSIEDRYDEINEEMMSPAIYIGCMFGMLKLKDGRFRCWK